VPRLHEIMAGHGWPDHELAGEEGTIAAWFVVQPALVEAGQEGIAMYEGRPSARGAIAAK
jgi:hypothetical protein